MTMRSIMRSTKFLALLAGAAISAAAFSAGFWVDRKQKLVASVMTQTSNREFLSDFENMVMQAVVD